MLQREIDVGKLLLDPNNYRFAETSGFVAVDERRFAEPLVQDRALQRLRGEEGIVELKKSILRNGLLPIERIVVRSYRLGQEADYYLVIEGNRRVAAAKWIRADFQAGADIPEPVLHSIANIPCILLEAGEDNEVFRTSLMGIRHVSGIKQWGGYQRAKLVFAMKDDLHLDSGEIAERLGMSAHEVNRRYRAYKALEQMKQDEEYGDYAAPALYPIFHEAVSLPVVRDWLGWDAISSTFRNVANLEQFYSLLVPPLPDEEDSGEPKITSSANVRDLRLVLSNAEARELLFQPDSTFSGALAVVRQRELTGAWLAQVQSTLAALRNLGIDAVRNFTSQQVQALTDLRETAGRRLQDHDTLSR